MALVPSVVSTPAKVVKLKPLSTPLVVKTRFCAGRLPANVVGSCRSIVPLDNAKSSNSMSCAWLDDVTAKLNVWVPKLATCHTHCAATIGSNCVSAEHRSSRIDKRRIGIILFATRDVTHSIGRDTSRHGIRTVGVQSSRDESILAGEAGI